MKPVITLLFAALLFHHAVHAQTTLDAEFNGTGIITGQTLFEGINMIESGSDIFYDPAENKILLLNAYGGEAIPIVRFNEDGSYDETFGDAGISTIDVENELDLQRIFKAGSNYTLAGFADDDGMAYPALMQIQEDGMLNIDFADEGFSILNTFNSFISKDAVMDASGNFFIAGRDEEESDDRAAIMKFNADGSYNAEFGYDPFSINYHTQFYSLALLDNGNIVATGFTWEESFSGVKGMIVCYAPDGELVSSFDTDGIFYPTPPISNYSYEYFTITQDATGNIYAAGYISLLDGSSPLLIASFDENGNMNTGFSEDGFMTIEGLESIQAEDIKPAPGGGIYILTLDYPDGDVTYQTNIYKVNTDGTLATDFGNGTPGSFLIEIPGANDIIGDAIAVQADGKILVTGSVYGFSLNSDFFICRINAPGVSEIMLTSDAGFSQIYPNPASSIINYDLSPGDSKIDIYTMSGNFISTIFLYGEKTQQVNIENFENGIYILKITGANGIARSTYFIKQ